MKVALAFCIFICGSDANSAELPLPKTSFTQSYTVTTAAEARTRLLQSKILAEKELGSENLDYIASQKATPDGSKMKVTYTWKRK